MKKNIFIWLLIFVFINTAYGQTKDDKAKGLKKISQDRREDVSNFTQLSSLAELTDLCELSELSELGVDIGLSVVENIDISQLSIEMADLNLELTELNIDLKDLHIDMMELHEELMDLDIDIDFEPMVRDLNELSEKALKRKARKPEQ